MRIRLVLVNLLLIKTTADVGADFVLDYFLYKNAPRVVGFTCNDARGNVALTKHFAGAGIAANFARLQDEPSRQRLIDTDHHKLGIFIDARCDENSSASAILARATSAKLFDELRHWLLLLPASKNASNFVDDNNFNLATDFVLATPAYYGYELLDLYNPRKARGGALNATFLGTWNARSGLDVALTQNKYDRRSNLHGMYWKVYFFNSKYRLKNVSLEDHYVDFERTGTKDGLSKFGYNVVKLLAEMHNATLLLGEYQKWKKNDKIGPLTKALMYEEIDMGGTPITVFSEKLSMLKVVYTPWPFRTCFILRSPAPTDIKVREVLGPLDDIVWYLTSSMVLLFMAILVVNFYYEGEDGAIARFSNALIVTVGCLCQQGTNQPMQRISTRIVFLSIMIFSLLIYNYYSASVVSSRLNEQVKKFNDSLDSLAMTGLQVASEPMLYFDFFMHDNPKETSLFFRKKWQKVPESERFISPDRGMLLVKEGGFAYHTHPEVGYPYVNRLYDNREICELAEVHLAKPSFRSIVVGYNSSFVEIARRGFTWLSEVGIRQRQLRRWTSRKPRCRKDVLSASSTTIYEFAPHLIVLSIGMLMAVVLCSIEIVVCNYKIKNRFGHGQISCTLCCTFINYNCFLNTILIICKIKVNESEKSN